MEHTNIVRLAGLYGPGRVIGQAGISQGLKISGSPEAWLNLIHVDDAAALLQRIAEMEMPSLFELGCDGSPVRRKDYYAFLAKRLNVPLPEFNHEPSRGIGRRCDNTLTCKRTAWRPQYKNYQQGINDLI